MIKKKQTKNKISKLLDRKLKIKNPVLENIVFVVIALVVWVFMYVVAITISLGMVIFFGTIIFATIQHTWSWETLYPLGFGIVIFLIGWGLSRLYTKNIWDVFVIPMP